MIVRVLLMMLTLILYIASYAWMGSYGIPFWPRMGIGTLFIVGALIGSTR